MLRLSVATRILNENPDTCAQILSTSLRLGTIIFSLFVLTGQVRLLQKWTFLPSSPPLFFHFSCATIFPFFTGYLLGFISVSKVTHFAKWLRTMEFDGVTVLLKSKLTVTRVLILETRDLILDSLNFPGSSLKSRGSSLESQWSRIEDQVSNFELRTCRESALFKSVHLTFHSKNYRPIHWVRLVHFQVNKAHALKVKNVQFWSPDNSPFETCFLEVKARYTYM